ncbi:alkaline phytoceramidase [Coemansia reversa NRRL 1564]|uniref:Alkaline phytoceramidase n=1 Tax=Coemansia reversa (strain ATCC 12441 / NRRL 1564) TaxID=763665 RepID=A0A2G5BI53_COERN|nr:alkaline phytoceramidase [Coemansia reversa NRRL 1564]|eukprot:PIA18661.1 alkaline phytoceramidase [Coemansia reversa NRRL 1564]
MAPLGFWGDVTSSVDWCEENYEWTPYIAEFFNSWSSIAMIILGEACARMNPTGYNAFTLLGRSITVVGIGSWLFHATLKYSMQMTDELPMLWSISIACYIGLTSQYNVNNRRVKHLLIMWALFISLMTAGFSGKAQFVLFQASFNVLSFVVAFLCWRAKRDLEKSQMGHVGALFSAGIKWYLAAAIVWLTDTNLCSYINGLDSSILPFNMQLHAWWHVLASLGLVYLVVLLMGHYCLLKGIAFKLRYILGVFPHIHAE